MAVTKVVMPKLSEAMESGKIIKWLKREGERVAGGDILAEVETDKADVEMEAFGAGGRRRWGAGPGRSPRLGTTLARSLPRPRARFPPPPPLRRPPPPRARRRRSASRPRPRPGGGRRGRARRRTPRPAGG